MSVVLFDFDYTLADTSVGQLECIGYALGSANLPVPEPNDILALVGVSLPETFAALAPGHPCDALIQAFLGRADVVTVELASVYPTVHPVLADLRRQGARLGIVSTKYRSRIEAIFAKAGLAGMVDVVVGGEDVQQVKPHPEGLLRAMRALQTVDSSEVVYVGDSVVDAAAAAAAGVRFVGVLSGVTSRAQLEAAGATWVIQDLSELSAMLARW